MFTSQTSLSDRFDEIGEPINKSSFQAISIYSITLKTTAFILEIPSQERSTRQYKTSLHKLSQLSDSYSECQFINCIIMELIIHSTWLQLLCHLNAAEQGSIKLIFNNNLSSS